MSDLFLMRTPPSQAMQKHRLLAAASAADFEPRENWLHPSAREFLSALEHFLPDLGIVVTGTAANPRNGSGLGASYTQLRSWSLLHQPTRQVAVITWNSLDGDLDGQLRGEVWRPLYDVLPEVVKHARANAFIVAGDVRIQTALCLMAAVPAAPFVVSGHTGNATYVITPAREAGRVQTYYTHLGRVSGLTTLTRAGTDTVRRIESSRARGAKMMVKSTGWAAICESSHQEILRLARESADV